MAKHLRVTQAHFTVEEDNPNFLASDTSRIKHYATSKTGYLILNSGSEAKSGPVINMITPSLPPQPPVPSLVKNLSKTLRLPLGELQIKDPRLEWFSPRAWSIIGKANKIHNELADYIKIRELRRAIKFIRLLYTTPNLLPTKAFSLCSYEKTDREVTLIVVSIIKRFSHDKPETWELSGIGAI